MRRHLKDARLMLRIIPIKSKHFTYIAQKPMRVLEFLFKILGGPSLS